MALSGFLQGFEARSAQHRQDSLRDAEAERDRNARVLSTLAGADDPEVSNMAITAILSGAAEGKPGKGLSGFFGQIRQHPLFQTLSTLVNSPKTVEHGHPLETAQGIPGQAVTASGAIPSRNIVDTLSHAAGTASVAAPPPASLGTPVHSLSYEMQEPRRVFDPELRAQREAAGGMSGRIQGVGQGYQTLTGQPLSADTAEDIARGVSGTPRRVQANIPGTLVLQSGQQVAGSYDQERDIYLDDRGQPITGVRQFLRGNPNSGQGAGTLHYERDASGEVRAYDREGNFVRDLGQVGKPQQPPALFQGTMTTPSGAYGITRGGQPVPLQIPRGVDPEVYASQLQALMSRIQASAQARTSRFGNMAYDTEALQQNLDQDARAQGFESWAQLQATYGEAVRAVGKGVPAAAAPPPAPVQPGKSIRKPPAAPAASGNPDDPFGILAGPAAAGGRKPGGGR